MEKKVVYFDSTGESGNIFDILSQVYRTIDIEEYKECSQRVFKSNSYEEALGIIEEYVHLEDVSK